MVHESLDLEVLVHVDHLEVALDQGAPEEAHQVVVQEDMGLEVQGHRYHFSTYSDATDELGCILDRWSFHVFPSD